MRSPLSENPRAAWTDNANNYRLCRRVLSFNNYEKPATNTFALNKLPTVHEWGTSRPFEDKSGLLCTPGKNEPFVLWIVGRVSRTWFFDKQSNPAPQVSINIVPVNDHAGQAARQTLCNLSKPAICMFMIIAYMTLSLTITIASTADGWGDLRATKWQNSRASGGNDAEVSTSK